MRITRLQLTNWRNFKTVDVQLAERVLIFGPNAAGKSNLLDAIRFLRDLTTSPGGLQYAVDLRGGMKRLRYLNARKHNSGRVGVAVEIGDHDSPAEWRYELHLTHQRSTGRPVVASELVSHRGVVVHRSDHDEDPELSTQTSLEQVSLSRQFRAFVDFLAGIEYLHLVPQIVRDPARGGSTPRDPYGGTFLAEVGRCPARDFERRRRIMEAALRVAVPKFESLQRVQDGDGSWHLQAKYKNFRPNAAEQDERDFSDGTLRLIGLLWTLSDKAAPQAPVLLEEPELSLHAEIIKVLPSLLQRASASGGRQVIASSHGTQLLDDPGVSPDEVLLLLPGAEATTVKLASDDPLICRLVESGSFTLGEAAQSDLVLPEIGQLMMLKMT